MTIEIVDLPIQNDAFSSSFRLPEATPFPSLPPAPHSTGTRSPRGDPHQPDCHRNSPGPGHRRTAAQDPNGSPPGSPPKNREKLR